MTSTYVIFTPYGASPLTTDATPQTSLPNRDMIGNPIRPATVFPLTSWSFEVEQTVSFNSAGGVSGVSQGKIMFDGLSLIRAVDNISSTLFTYCANGTAFNRIDILAMKPGATQIYLQYTFKLAAVRSIAPTFDGEQVNENLAFDYGGYQIHYGTPRADGTTGKVVIGGWNRVLNVTDTGDLPL